MRLLTFILVLAAWPALAAPIDGWLIATEVCPATRRINEPGSDRVMIEPTRAYKLLEVNKRGGDFVRVRVPGAPGIEERWVRRSCGVHAAAVGDAPREPTEPRRRERPRRGAESVSNVLAVSWHPAFCETGAGRSKAECRQLDDGDLAVFERGFSLHGLWPQPRSKEWCGAEARSQRGPASRSHRMKAIGISPEVLDDLATVMAGTASQFQRYQFYKHGSCFNDPDGVDGYWRDAISLMRQLNGSAVGRLFADNGGRAVSKDAVRAAFDEAFGAGASRRVRFDCHDDNGRTLYLELRIALEGTIEPDSRLGDLIMAARPTGDGEACRGARVDRPGNQ